MPAIFHQCRCSSSWEIKELWNHTSWRGLPSLGSLSSCLFYSKILDSEGRGKERISFACAMVSRSQAGIQHLLAERWLLLAKVMQGQNFCSLLEDRSCKASATSRNFLQLVSHCAFVKSRLSLFFLVDLTGQTLASWPLGMRAASKRWSTQQLVSLNTPRWAPKKTRVD